ncbi:MAG: bifunctional pyr operon transcriptional regulator/uracil phosphoribosyltransferase PyrR [Betaproteobacteria bacterium]|nr:bifunctional pyr operon transcriptional regulator/uracil phosphoribosyltransferase PyrR [Betaproteobacteria bacterium]MDE2124232.1 bifunctional pyr operon transcriptional regulator/uracil phosphoribosyltransferase PyrR [Betaproteobacteria bacterium]MDE2186625.1 bifunctional pyr operon transcriptional regulator/uracil phosphoribosyltransferase PyrR [Betaproteobacteria bacterium]MDE2323368.1 bifunctional pyr operon transcriptional regulator/uracil phosphoribosyltransferase PyrR [Betaproteobacte
MTMPQAPDAEALYAQLLVLVRNWLARANMAAGNHSRAEPAIVGIYSGGAWLAERLHADLDLTTPFGVVSSTFHRDDFATRGLHPSANRTTLPFDVNGRIILLVDDVLYTGRTTRAALNELYDFGRPARVDLAVLIDRGGRELPICAQLCAAQMALPHMHMLALERDETQPQTMRLAFRLESKA